METESSHTPLQTDGVQIIPFCAPLPSANGEKSSLGVVGTLTLRGQSAVVWFGWGTIEACDEGASNASRINAQNGVISVGHGKKDDKGL